MSSTVELTTSQSQLSLCDSADGLEVGACEVHVEKVHYIHQVSISMLRNHTFVGWNSVVGCW